jgi:hypothetical protein
MSAFDISSDTMVVTTVYVAKLGMPILQVSHEDDEEGGALWQFHSGNEDYDPAKIQLVRLDTILDLDPSVAALARMPIGYSARRTWRDGPWKITPDRHD